MIIKVNIKVIIIKYRKMKFSYMILMFFYFEQKFTKIRSKSKIDIIQWLDWNKNCKKNKSKHFIERFREKIHIIKIMQIFTESN